jgi:hypothetical protein
VRLAENRTQNAIKELLLLRLVSLVKLVGLVKLVAHFGFVEFVGFHFPELTKLRLQFVHRHRLQSFRSLSSRMNLTNPPNSDSCAIEHDRPSAPHPPTTPWPQRPGAASKTWQQTWRVYLGRLRRCRLRNLFGWRGRWRQAGLPRCLASKPYKLAGNFELCVLTAQAL